MRNLWYSVSEQDGRNIQNIINTVFSSDYIYPLKWKYCKQELPNKWLLMLTKLSTTEGVRRFTTIQNWMWRQIYHKLILHSDLLLQRNFQHQNFTYSCKLKLFDFIHLKRKPDSMQHIKQEISGLEQSLNSNVWLNSRLFQLRLDIPMKF